MEINTKPASNARITFTKDRKERLRKAYRKAHKAGQDQFIFEGYEFHTGYARFLLEYLDMKLP